MSLTVVENGEALRTRWVDPASVIEVRRKMSNRNYPFRTLRTPNQWVEFWIARGIWKFGFDVIQEDSGEYLLSFPHALDKISRHEVSEIVLEAVEYCLDLIMRGWWRDSDELPLSKMEAEAWLSRKECEEARR